MTERKVRTPAGLHRKYRRRMRELLRGIGLRMQAYGFRSEEPIEMTDDEYAYTLSVEPPVLENEACGCCAGYHPVGWTGDCRDDLHRFPGWRVPRVDFTVTLLEEVAREGEGKGVAWSIDAVEEGGRIMAGCTPHNYTARLWVAVDSPEVEERFQAFEEMVEEMVEETMRRLRDVTD